LWPPCRSELRSRVTAAGRSSRISIPWRRPLWAPSLDAAKRAGGIFRACFVAENSGTSGARGALVFACVMPCHRQAAAPVLREFTVSSKTLTTYRKKRDFDKTSEPRGDAAVAPSKRRRFVIQKHDATRLHYDLRLEFDGVFKSWAVTRVPRSIRVTSGSRSRWRITRSITAISKAPFQGRVWRRHRAALGPRLLGGRRSRQGLQEGRSEI